MQLPIYKNKNMPISERVEDLISKMTFEEMVRGIVVYFPNGNLRLGIPNMQSGETCHGPIVGGGTMYPQALSLGATWDEDLIKRLGTAIAKESRDWGIQIAFAPMLALARDARWGRIEESYGEDPCLVSKIGCAYISGLQGEGDAFLDKDHVISVAKHFVADGEPSKGINGAPMDMSEISLRELHFRPFEDAIKKVNLYGIMPAHHSINRVPCHANKWLLDNIARKEWGFGGLVISDMVDIPKLYSFAGALDKVDYHQHRIAHSNVEAGILALRAGVDVELGGEWNTRCYGKGLLEVLESGDTEALELVKTSLRRVLDAKIRLGLFDDGKLITSADDPNGKQGTSGFADGDEEYAVAVKQGFMPGKEHDIVENIRCIDCETYDKLTLEVAEKAIILLKNDDNLLPLDKNKLKRIAVIGQNATDMLLGGYSTGKPRYYVNVVDGIRAFCGNDVEVVHGKGCEITNKDSGMGKEWEEIKHTFVEAIPEAVQLAKSSDVAILVLGGNRSICGENTDIDEIDLPWAQRELIKNIYATGTPVVLVMINGRPNGMVWEADNIPAIVQTFYLGQETGTALANMLFGEINPCGKLPIAIPKRSAHIPVLYNRLWWASPNIYKGSSTSVEPLYPFGFGKSYTTFEYSDLNISKTEMTEDETITVSVTITNTGEREGSDVVQMYIRDEFASIVRPLRELKNFEKVTLVPKESTTVTLPIAFEDIKFWNDGKWVAEKGTFKVFVGNDSTCESNVCFSLV